MLVPIYEQLKDISPLNQDVSRVTVHSGKVTEGMATPQAHSKLLCVDLVLNHI